MNTDPKHIKKEEKKDRISLHKRGGGGIKREAIERKNSYLTSLGGNERGYAKKEFKSYHGCMIFYLSPPPGGKDFGF